VGPYLTLFARAGTPREAADAAVARVEIHELPSARGCTYVLPASDYALGLRVGRSFGAAEMKVAANLGVTSKEIEKLCASVLKALAKGPLDPQGIREATGNASRSLGEEGKKKGVTTTLPLALGELQARGEIRRIPTNGRLDQERYRYVLWKPGPLQGAALSDEEATLELARRYFRWIGPASLMDFRSFSCLPAKSSKAAVEELKLAPLGAADDRLMLPGQREEFESFRVPKEPAYALVSGLDGLLLLRRDPDNLVDGGGREAAAFVQKALREIPHAILDRGRVAGVWLYDPEAASIVWLSLLKRSRALEEAVARTDEFVRTQLGDARSSSQDSPKSRAARIAALRKAGGVG
jgi:hypothetical protein